MTDLYDIADQIMMEPYDLLGDGRVIFTYAFDSPTGTRRFVGGTRVLYRAHVVLALSYRRHGYVLKLIKDRNGTMAAMRELNSPTYEFDETTGDVKMSEKDILLLKMMFD